MEPIEFSLKGIGFGSTLDYEKKEQLPSFLQRNVFIIGVGIAITMCKTTRPDNLTTTQGKDSRSTNIKTI
jgi:hypothetical protein